MRKSSGRDLYQIEKDLIEMENMSCKPSFKKPRPGDVINEDRSVRWNREEVERLRDKYEAEVKELNTKKNKKRDDLYNEIFAYMQHEAKGLSLDGAKKIFDYAHQRFKGDGVHEFIRELDNLTDLVSMAMRDAEEYYKSKYEKKAEKSTL